MNKKIGIDNRIPLHILDTALYAFLNDNYSNEYILEQLSMEYSGENRLKKCLRIINRIIVNNPLKDWLLENRELLNLAIKRKEDRGVIIISMLNIAYPFSYGVLFTFGKYFSVQNLVSTEIISKTISSIYGNNRSLHTGMYSVMPLFIEAGFFSRKKVGLFEFGAKLNCHSSIAKDIYIKSFKENCEIEAIAEYVDYDNPYFYFMDLDDVIL